MIHNEDCLETMARMDAGSLDMILTSPPYEDLRKYQGFSFDFARTASSMLRVLKDGGVASWVIGDRVRNGCESLTHQRHSVGFVDAGFLLRYTLIYKKKQFAQPGTAQPYWRTHEYILVLTKGRPATINTIKDRPNIHAGLVRRSHSNRQEDGTTSKRGASGAAIEEFGARGTVWEYDAGYMKSTTDKIAYEHPAIMPEKLAEDQISTWSDPGDTVYDPFMGSGTTAKAARTLKRRWIGSEISAKYCRLAERRLAGEE